MSVLMNQKKKQRKKKEQYYGSCQCIAHSVVFLKRTDEKEKKGNELKRKKSNHFTTNKVTFTFVAPLICLITTWKIFCVMKVLESGWFPS